MSRTPELIAAIYAATLPAQDFNRVFDELDALLFEPETGERDGGVAELLAPGTLAHIETARSIQDRVGRAKSPEQQFDIILGSIPNPSYLVTRRGEIVALNAMAAARHVQAPVSLADCLPDEAAQREVSAFVGRNKTGRLLAVAAHTADAPGASQTSVLVKRVDAGLLVGESGPLFLLSILDLGFTDDAVALFRQAFELTEAETTVAVLLATGLSLPDITAQRGVALDTVRTQIKTIKNKTGVRDIPALVRLMYGFNAGTLAQTGGPATVARAPERPRRQYTLPDGRRMIYVEQGHPDGAPVLLFHNLPYGADLPAAAIAEAQRRRLRFISPFRPGFGGSDEVDFGGDELVTQVARDCADLLTHLGVSQVVALSHSTSAPFALRFARLYPQLVTRLVGVSRPPAWRDAWLKQAPQRQRFVLQLARRAPQLLPVVAWAMVACMESSYATEFVVYNCKDGPADARAVQDQETVDFIAKGSVEALRHGLNGFCRECGLALRDFTAEARAARHKFHILHGADDWIVHPEQSLSFARDVPGTTIEIVDGAGQLLFYSHWQHVLDAVAPQRADARERIDA